MSTLFDSSSDSTKLSVEKLNVTNYYIWSNKLELVVRGRGLWGFTNGTEQIPGEPQGADALKKYLLRKDQAISLILLPIEDQCIAPVIGLRDPKEIWDCLKSMHEKSSEASIDAYLVQYQGLKMKPTEKVLQFVNLMIELESKLAGVGHPLSDADKKRALLRGLRSEFAVTAGVIRATEKSFNDAVGLLVIVEAEEALTEVKTEIKTERAFNTREPHGSKRVKCNFCSKLGHKAKDCFKNPDSKKCKGPRRDVDTANGADQHTLITFIASEAIESSARSSKWFIDSGATAHMCNDKALFNSLKEENEGRTVTIGDGSPLPVLGEGAVRATTVVNGQTMDVALKNVLFVPKFSANLISVRKCKANGLRMIFEENKNGRGICTAEHVESSTVAFIGLEREDNGLFEAGLRVNPSKEFNVMAIPTSSNLLWHFRLGHASEGMITKTIPLVQGIDIKKFKLKGTCTTCRLSKSRRQPRPPRSYESKKATEILDLVHCDLMGPISNKSISGARYFLPLLDDSSGLSMVRLLKTKDESTVALQEMIALMEKTTGRSVKRLRSDNASELLSNRFQNWLRERGIQHETSPVYSPESNGKAERILQTLMNTTRCLLRMGKNIPNNKSTWDEAVLTANYL